MRILYAASEANPFAKSGGLADVAGALPKALVKDGVDARVIMPLYGDLKHREMLEYVNYCGKYYGTPKSEVDARLDRGTTVVLVIEVVGAANIKKLYPESTLIFIMPPSMDELRARLRGRGTESEEAIAGRLKRAEEELPYAREYDFSVENRDVDACADEIYRILKQRQQD